MSDRWNLGLGIASAIWSAVVGLLVVPFFLRYLGLDAYGLIGFFMALQAILSILDMGLAPTMSRETARCSAIGRPDEARNLLYTLSVIYWITAVLIGLIVAVLAGPIADHWLRDAKLPPSELRHALTLMGLIIGLRWPAGIYSGALLGQQKLSHVSLVNIAVTAVTNFGALFVLAFISATIEAFFLWQAVVAVGFVLTMRALAWRAVGTWSARVFDVEGLKRVWRFSVGLSVATILGVVFMQSDKVVLSRIVPLDALGAYTLAGVLARTLYIVLTPTFNVIYPRLTALLTAGDDERLNEYYDIGSRLLTAVIFPAAAVLTLFAHEVIEMWTRNGEVARLAAPVLPFIAIGTALNGVMHFPYALQLAAGRSRLPAIINAALLLIFVPLLAVLAVYYGIVGAAAAWAILNLAYVLFGTMITHRVIMVGGGARWLLRAILPNLIITVVVMGAGLISLRKADFSDIERLGSGVVFAAAATLTCCLVNPQLLALVSSILRRGIRGTADPLIRTNDVA